MCNITIYNNIRYIIIIYKTTIKVYLLYNIELENKNIIFIIYIKFIISYIKLRAKILAYYLYNSVLDNIHFYLSHTIYNI